MFEILSYLLRYLFITVIYLFIFGIIKLIYLDIQSMSRVQKGTNGNVPYLKLLNIRDNIDFKLEEVYALNGNITIGRSGRNDISIQDQFISSEHVRFLKKDDNIYLEDLNSKNGSFINGQRITGQPVMLRNGDKIHIGQLDFIYVNNSL